LGSECVSLGGCFVGEELCVRSQKLGGLLRHSWVVVNE
jgi:hypothetical protein